ncbi:hypothetical protein ACULN0_11140 [Pectobacterium actinidiae]
MKNNSNKPKWDSKSGVGSESSRNPPPPINYAKPAPTPAPPKEEKK